MRRSLRNYFASADNWIDLLSISSVPTLHYLLSVESSFALPVASIGTILLLPRFAKVARGIAKLSSLVSMLRSIATEMRLFLIIMTTVLGITSHALTLQLEAAHTEYETFGAGLFTAYSLMLGNFGSVEYADQSPTVLALILFFTLSVNIILLNTLIAIISDTYEKELDKSRQASLLERATLLCEIEDVDLSEAELLRLDYFPDWLHVLKRKNDAGKEEVWSGFLNAMRSNVDAQTDKVAAKVQALIAAQGADAKAQVDGVKAQVDEMRNEIRELNGLIRELTVANSNRSRK